MVRRPLPSLRKKKKRGRRPPPLNETRYDRFNRVGTRRMQNVIHHVRLIGNLCRPIYACEADDLVLIRDTIISELDMALARFTPRVREIQAQAFSFHHKSPALAEK